MIEFEAGDLNESRLATELRESMEFSAHNSISQSTKSLNDVKVNLLRSDEEMLFFTPRV